ncbi:MAG: tonB [Rhodospirillales bacterium]|nr:tonB [Rhodospirillales bacterium]
MALAYCLAFHPAVQLQPEPPVDIITMTQASPSTPPKSQLTPTFQPDRAPVIEEVHTTVGTLPLPPRDSFDRTPPTMVTTTEPPSPTVIINPKPIYRGGLIYPDKAADRGVPGYVDFSFIIEPDGSVGDPQVIAEVPDGYGFAAAARKAFPKWRFAPKLVNGKPVAAPAQIRVTFKLM